ncbi:MULTISPECIES: hypothetical protein [unclassified Burkholderia]|uniref:hypothetical protein n=1 Tax=unclassified Burkholderia TaxID=2613784 RepID=UPI000F56E051|nr:MULTISPECIES: hypothetical protein [unclassified Burkholderia]RQR42161.1 hypothetical protein DIE22_01110 [Burkholderia sp. Bp9142]RQR56553.1 hypothetical protein DIE21_02665 [Burkholderia sp. Bp9140]
MALDFSRLPPEEPIPDTPPSRFVWTIVFLVLTLLGVFAVLILWPPAEPTRTPWFWVSVTVYPVGFAALVASRPFSMYEGRRLRVHAWNAACKQYTESAFERESVPVLVLGTAICVTENDVENDVDAIVAGTLKLDARASTHEENGSMKARWLAPIDARLAKNDSERQEIVLDWLYGRLLNDLSASISVVPAELPLRVWLDVSGYTGEMDAIELWRKKWSDRKFRSAHADRAPESLDLMAIDSWLDDERGPLTRRASLVISITLRNVIAEEPADGTAEAGVGLLLASVPVASRFRLQPVAALHRPRMSSDGDLDHALTYALRWGSVDPGAIGALWTTGFDGQTVGRLHATLRQVGQEKASGEAAREFDLNRTVGHVGASAGWLAAACALHQTKASSTSQLVAQRLEDRTFVAVTTVIDNESKKTHALA